MLRIFLEGIKRVGIWNTGSMDKLESPMPVSVALACRTSPARPAGRTKDVPISVETPVIYCPFDASAREPSVSVSEVISPPWAADTIKVQVSKS
jgi:hypothetical protein